MAGTLVLAEETIQRLAPDTSAMQAARGLVRKKAFKTPGISSDGTWLLAQCQGSGKEPYEVSVDLADPAVPVGRCTCPSRKFPCKHALGLMLAYLEGATAFSEREPPEELLAKREKQTQRRQKAVQGKTEPRKVNQAALLKKAQTQREGLDLLEKLVVDLVAGGQWTEPARVQRLERQARQMNDHYLPGAAQMVRQLVVYAGQNWTDEERNEIGSQIISALWATAKRGRNYLDGKLAGDETQAEADAAVEDVLGRTWQLVDLRTGGYYRQDLHLLELAHETRDDPARQEKVETSFLLDLQGGEVFRAVSYRPYKGLRHIPEQPSYTEALHIAEAAVYPGFMTRRIRWEPAAQKARPLPAGSCRTAYSLAVPNFETALANYKKSLKNPLAMDAVAASLLRCARVGKVGDEVVLEDAQGNRLLAKNRMETQPNVANLVRAAGMVRELAVLVSFHVTPSPTRIFTQPLAALTPEVHLRLGW